MGEEKRLRAFDTIKLGTDFEERTHPIHGPSLFYKDIVIAREIVQEYDDGVAYKPADELEKTAPYAGPRWAISGRHPETGLLMDVDDIHGLFEEPYFVKNLKDHGRTERENNRGIKGNLWAFQKKIPPQIYGDMKKGKRQDVSIGFVFTQDQTPGTVQDGPLKGLNYDYIQRDILIDHLTFGINNGRCPMPNCGLGADSNIPLTVTQNAYRLLSQRIDRGNMPQVLTDLSLADINKKIKELKDQLDVKRQDINKLYGQVDNLYKKAEEESKPIFSKIEVLWADFDDIYDELRAYREAKILLLTKTAAGESVDKETDEDKAKRAMEHFGFSVDEWGKQPNDFKTILLDKVPVKQVIPCVDRIKVVLGDILVSQDEESKKAVKTVLDMAITLKEDGTPEIANDIYRKLTTAKICWPCLDEFVYDYKKAPEDDPWEYKESDYDEKQLSYASSYIEIDGEIHGFGYTGEDLTKAACHLPHHLPGDGASHGGTLVWAGVSAAGAAIMGSRGASITGKAAETAKAHLAKHYKEFDKTPPWDEEKEDSNDYETLRRKADIETRRAKTLLKENQMTIGPAKNK